MTLFDQFRVVTPFDIVLSVGCSLLFLLLISKLTTTKTQVRLTFLFFLFLILLRVITHISYQDIFFLLHNATPFGLVWIPYSATVFYFGLYFKKELIKDILQATGWFYLITQGVCVLGYFFIIRN